MSEEMDLRLAVLIDADNAPRSALGDVMAEIAVYEIGRASCRERV